MCDDEFEDYVFNVHDLEGFLFEVRSVALIDLRGRVGGVQKKGAS